MYEGDKKEILTIKQNLMSLRFTDAGENLLEV